MPLYVGLESRAKASILAIFGMGFAYAKGRDWYLKKVDVSTETSKKKKVFHESAYNVMFNAVVSPIIYLSSGATISQTVVGTLGTMVLGVFSGPINGFGVDVSRELFSMGKSKRLPYHIRNAKSSVRHAIATGGLLACIGLTAGVYASDTYLDKNVSIDINKDSAHLRIKDTLYTVDWSKKAIN